MQKHKRSNRQTNSIMDRTPLTKLHDKNSNYRYCQRCGKEIEIKKGKYISTELTDRRDSIELFFCNKCVYESRVPKLKSTDTEN